MLTLGMMSARMEGLPVTFFITPSTLQGSSRPLEKTMLLDSAAACSQGERRGQKGGRGGGLR